MGQYRLNDVIINDPPQEAFSVLRHKPMCMTSMKDVAAAWATATPKEKQQIKEFIEANSNIADMRKRWTKFYWPHMEAMVAGRGWAFIRLKNLDTGKQFLTVAFTQTPGTVGLSVHEIRKVVGLKPSGLSTFKPGRQPFSLGEVPLNADNARTVRSSSPSRAVRGGPAVRPVVAVARPKVDISKLVSRSGSGLRTKAVEKRTVARRPIRNIKGRANKKGGKRR